LSGDRWRQQTWPAGYWDIEIRRPQQNVCPLHPFIDGIRLGIVPAIAIRNANLRRFPVGSTKRFLSMIYFHSMRKAYPQEWFIEINSFG
jgi:hypothetical protein